MLVKLIAAAFSTVMALLFTWVAAWLAVDEVHAWKVVSVLSAFVFAFVAVMTVVSWVVDGEDNLR
jgi:hypothetical protein